MDSGYKCSRCGQKIPRTLSVEAFHRVMAQCGHSIALVLPQDTHWQAFVNRVAPGKEEAPYDEDSIETICYRCWPVAKIRAEEATAIKLNHLFVPCT